MSSCARCGAENAATNTFCSACGAALAPPPPPRVLPPTPGSSRASGAGATWTFDWRSLVAGNWVGAGLTALVALVVTGTAAGVLGLLAKPEDLGVANTLTLVTVIATSAFGADLTGDLDLDIADSTASFSFGGIPLTITLVAMAAAATTFRRVVSSYPRPGPAVLDAVRAAVLFALGLLVPALVFRSDNDELGRGWGSDLSSDNLGFDAEVGANAAAAFFLGFLIMLCGLVVTLFLRRDWWPERVRRVQDLVAAPLLGYLTIVALLPLSGVVGLVSMGLFGEPTVEDTDPSGDTSALIALLVGGIANGGMWLLGLGTGARIGAEYSARGGGDTESSSEWSRLWGDVTGEEPGLWVAPFLLLAVLLVSALVVARRAPEPLRLANLGAWAIGFLVAAPWLVRISGLHGGLRAEDEDGTYRASYFVGLHGVETTLLLVPVALVVAAVAATLTGGLDVTAIRTRLRAVAGAVQTHPGKPPGPRPGQD